MSEDGLVHQRRGKLVCVVSDLPVEALETTLLAPEQEELQLAGRHHAPAQGAPADVRRSLDLLRGLDELAL